MALMSGTNDPEQYFPKEYLMNWEKQSHPKPKLSIFRQVLDSVRLKIFLSAAALLMTALGFNALFNFATLDRLYTESGALSYHVIGEDLRRDIQRSVASGQHIQQLDEINEKLTTAKRRIERLCLKSDTRQGHDVIPFSDFDAAISIYLPDGQLLHSTARNQLNTKALVPLDDPDKIKKDKQAYLGQSTVMKRHGNHFLQFPVRDAQNKWVATVLIAFKKNGSEGLLKGDYQEQFLSGTVLLLTGIVLLVLFLNVVVSGALNSRELPKKKITVVMFLIMAPILVIFSGLNTYHASRQYLDICQNKARMTLALAKEDIESSLGQGLTLEEAAKKDGKFLELLNPYPPLDALTLLDNEGNPVLEKRQEDINRPSDGYRRMVDFLFSKIAFANQTQHLEIFTDTTEPATGTVIVRISKDQVAREVFAMILNALTVVAISILFLIEILIFIFYFFDKTESREKAPQSIHYGLIRPVTFLFLFGIDVSISFIPLHMEKLFTPLFGLSRDTVMGLPISVEFFFVGISIFCCGFWNDRRGWHEPFLAGLFLAGTGVLYSWLAPDVVHFLISRAIVGTGYGLTLMAAQGFVIAFSDANTRTRAFSQFIAGLYAGSICGGATGALLSEKIGYGWVFLIGAMILYSIIVYSLIFMRGAMIRPRMPLPAGQQSSESGKSIFWRFMKNRIVLSVILLSSLPASIAAVGFLNYFSPIYLNRIGASQATIGRVFMVYGFSLVYLGPLIAKYVDRFNNKRNYVFVGCLLGSIAFIIFYFLDGLLAATMAVFLLGLSNSFIIASQSTYLLGLKVTHALGSGKAIGIFRASARIGQSLGPILFSGLFLSADIRDSVTKVGLLYLLTAVLFFMFTLKDTNQYARNS